MNSRARLRWITGALMGVLAASCGGGASQQGSTDDAPAGDATLPRVTVLGPDPDANAGSAPPALAPTARLIAPASGWTVGTARPSLRWSLPPGATVAHAEVCADAACERIEWSNDVPAGGAAVGRDLPPGVHFWRVRAADAAQGHGWSATWTFRTPYGVSNAAAGNWGLAPDYDGDGAPDLAVAGARFHDENSGGPEGLVMVFGNAGSSLSRAPDEVLSARPPMRGPLVALGDVDGDGRGDLGQSDASARDGGGEILVRHGGVGHGHEPFFGDGVRVTRVRSAPGDALGAVLGAAGDIDRDGYADAVASVASGAAWVELRGGPGGLRVGARHERPAGLDERFVVRGLFSAGDANCDGFDDVAVSYEDPAQDVSRVFLYWGTVSGAADLATDVGTYGGPAVVAASDADRDGCPDVAVAQTSTPTGGAARLTVLHAERGATTLRAETAVLLHGRGPQNVALVSGDFNGDGYGDFVLFHRGEDDGTPGTSMRLALVVGGPAGAALGQEIAFPRTADAHPDTTGGDGTASGAGGSTGAGAEIQNFEPEHVVGLGDIDADGYSDLVLEGRLGAGFVLRIYRGSPAGLVADPAGELHWDGDTPGPDNVTLTRLASGT